MAAIYHVTTEEQWRQGLAAGEYQAASLGKEGFIHCCEERQLAGVLERYFSGKKNLLALEINTDILTSPLCYENAPSVNENFPHVYGPINIETVETVMSLT
jgi:uncharacterized protein (DUF952 family)